MMRSLVFFTILIAPFFLMWSNEPARGVDLAPEYEKLASEFEFFGFNEIVYNEADSYSVDGESLARYRLTLKNFEARHDTVDDLLPLLKHPNPKVRLLAITSLYLTNDPRYLGQLFDLRDDRETAYPDMIYNPISPSSGIGPGPGETRTVGLAASGVVATYMNAAGWKWPVRGTQDRTYEDQHYRDFAAYWSARYTRDTCASWWWVGYAGILRHFKYKSPAAASAIHEFRRKIDLLPLPYRNYIIYYLIARSGPFEPGFRSLLIDDAELNRICRDTGHDELARLLHWHTDLGDPDLMSEDIGLIIARHAPQLLTRQDARDVYCAGDAILAAKLDPSKAASWLMSDMDRKPALLYRNDELAAALWEIVGPSEQQYLHDWYYSANTEEQVGFLRAAGGKRPPEMRALIARIVSDPRFPNNDAESTRKIAQVINQWTATPVVSERELAGSNYPDWQAEIRLSYPEWAPSRTVGDVAKSPCVFPLLGLGAALLILNHFYLRLKGLTRRHDNRGR